MAKPRKKKIAVCSSAAFYTEVVTLSYELEKLDLEILLPKTAAKMKAKEQRNNEVILDWSTAPAGYHGKAVLIREHFDEITRCDAILVANYEKHGMPNYIGPNVLMEMAVGFYLNKPIYVLNDCPTSSALIDEILGLEPLFLSGNTTKLQLV